MDHDLIVAITICDRRRFVLPQSYKYIISSSAKGIHTLHYIFLYLQQRLQLEIVNSREHDSCMKSTPYPTYVPAECVLRNMQEILMYVENAMGLREKRTSSMNRTPGTSSATPSSIYRLTTWHHIIFQPKYKLPFMIRIRSLKLETTADHVILCFDYCSVSWQGNLECLFIDNKTKGNESEFHQHLGIYQINK